MARTVNATDRAIIRLLQRNARVSYAELSRETGIPESTVRRRMDRLQSLGVIEFAMLAEPAKLGYDLRAMIGLKVELRRLQEIGAELRAMNEVTFAAFLTGNFDVMIQVVVRSQEALVAFLTERLAPIEGLRSTETFVMPYVIKPTTAWVLPETTEGPTNGAAEAVADDEAGGEDTTPTAVANGSVASAEPGPPRRRGRPRKAAS